VAHPKARGKKGPRPRPPKLIAAALARRIKELRAERNLSQDKLAEESGIHRTFIAGLEVGTRNPSLATLARLARALGVPIRELFEED
jgi:transcriptional regulator with XRE-family HTH domain